MLKDALRSRKTHILLVLAGWLSGLAALADHRRTAQRSRDFGGGLGKGEHTRDAAVSEPERFHVQLLQTYGRVSGTQEKCR